MRLSDIKGEKSLDIIADAMELAELIGSDERFTDMAQEMKELDGKTEDAWRVLCRHLPAILRDGKYKKRIVSIFATASDSTYEEYAASGSILYDLSELLLTDSEALGFLAGSSVSQK